MAHDFGTKSSMLHLDKGVTFPDAKSPMPSTLAVRAWDFLLFSPGICPYDTRTGHKTDNTQGEVPGSVEVPQ